MNAPFQTGQQFTLERAQRGHDSEFERTLAAAIMEAITRTSMITDVNAVVLRTGEMIMALTTVLASSIALSPHARSPTALRKAADQIAKDIRRQVQAALAEPGFQVERATFFDDGEPVGHA